MEEIKVNLENLTEEERKTLMDLVQKGNKPKEKKRWKPDFTGTYWYIGASGGITYAYWLNSSFDSDVYSLNNCFRNKEDAEKALRKKRVLAKIESFAQEHDDGDVNWEDSNAEKYSIKYTRSKGIPEIITSVILQDFGITYFASKKIAQECLDELGEEIMEAFKE